MRAPTPATAAASLLVASLLACSCKPDAPGAPVADTPVSATAPIEDEDAVPGGPVDLSDFDFDVDAPDEKGPPPTLMGIDAVRPETAAALAPYLDVHRAKLAAVRGDGQQILVLTRSEFTTQLHAVDGPGQAPRPLTTGKDGVQQAAYVPGTKDQILFRRDKDGNEVHQLYSLNATTGATARITDGTHRHGQFRVLGTKPLRIGLTANMRSEADADLIALTAPAFEPEVLAQLSGTNVLIGRAERANGFLVRQVWSTERSRLVRVQDDAEPELIPTEDTPEGTYVDARVSATDADRSLLYFTSDLGGEWVRLFASDGEGNVTPVTPEVEWDVEAFASLGEHGLVYVLNEDGFSRVYWQAPATDEPPKQLDIPDGVVSGLRRLGPTKIAFTHVSATSAADVYDIDVQTQEITRWTHSDVPDEHGEPRVAPSVVRIATADDLEVPALVYEATTSDPAPVLLWMHGGPEEQSRPEFNPIIQYFAQHGITVIAPNIRGSDGYGRTWRQRDNGVLRGAAIEDVGAVLDWISQQPNLDERRVGIFGGSYGGYMTLAALAFHPERFVAGCDLVGISHIPRFLEHTAPYRRELRREEYGDERDPDVRAVLEDLSPFNFADRITAPLFVAHGANDPRVPVAEARQIFDAVRATGAAPWLLVANDEGHSMKKRDNRDLFYGLMVDFFTIHLLEREPVPREPRSEAG